MFTKLAISVSCCFGIEQIVNTATCFLSFVSRRSISGINLQTFRSSLPLGISISRWFPLKKLFCTLHSFQRCYVPWFWYWSIYLLKNRCPKPIIWKKSLLVDFLEHWYFIAHLFKRPKRNGASFVEGLNRIVYMWLIMFCSCLGQFIAINRRYYSLTYKSFCIEFKVWEGRSNWGLILGARQKRRQRRHHRMGFLLVSKHHSEIVRLQIIESVTLLSPNKRVLIYQDVQHILKTNWFA